jgi:hypothetical protein
MKAQQPEESQPVGESALIHRRRCSIVQVTLLTQRSALFAWRNQRMRRAGPSTLMIGLLVLTSLPMGAQAPAQPEGAVAVKNGGVFVPGWTGKIDANEEKAGQVLSSSRLAQEGSVLHVSTGPAVTYWNPANTVAGNYTVKATFLEPKYMSINDHPHPYGIMIGGNDLGTPQQSYLYCAAYGNGTFILRGFGPAPFQVGGAQPASNAAIHKAAGVGLPVSQDIAVSVKDDTIECAINGTVVASYEKAALVTPGRLKSTDGVYGIRFAHNTDAIVIGLSVTKP